MSDDAKFTTNQEKAALRQAEERKYLGNTRSTRPKSNHKEEDKDKELPASATLYSQGQALLEGAGFKVELDELGGHCNLSISKAAAPPSIKGINYPNNFRPYREIFLNDDLTDISRIFKSSNCSQKTRDFWSPLFNPKAGDSDLSAHTDRLIFMKKQGERAGIRSEMKLEHSFDPAGRIHGVSADNPKLWVPDKSWFSPSLHQVGLEDVFTIFPRAEIEMLRLLLGRIGVGRHGHFPSKWDCPVKHTARMAAVIIGKDPGLGKSSLFNGMIAAFTKCGFRTSTFRSTKDRFGVSRAALSDIAYKDDTSLNSLKEFLASEETKTIITGGALETEEKFKRAEQIYPRAVFILNSNDWNSKFTYDLDAGIMDRVKLITTLREHEVLRRKVVTENAVSRDSPDLRPLSHLPFLARKLGVDEEALYLWCLRLATDDFWNIITDNSDPSINQLQVSVRYWTTRMRNKFRNNILQSVVNALALSWSFRTGIREIPELNPVLLKECLEHLYFLGVDPSGQDLTRRMKDRWEASGRVSTHYFQGIRELRWDSVRKAHSCAIDRTANEVAKTSTETFSETIKEIMGKLDFRDGFKTGSTANYIIESWENMRHNCSEIAEEVEGLKEGLNERDFERIMNLRTLCYDKWLDNRQYSPDRAEILREKAKAEIYKSAKDSGVK